MRWHTLGYQRFSYADQNGKIHGEVLGGYRDYTAMYKGKMLGTYISEETAKKAVEQAHQENK